MGYNKYQIILDTTNLYTTEFNVKNFNQPVLDFKNFVNKYGKTKVLLYIPEIVRDERIDQNVKAFLKHKRTIIDSFSKISDSDVKINLCNLEEFNYEKKITERLNKIIKNNGFEVIEYTKIDSKQIIKRFFRKDKPFNENSDKEKGFKDTMIWLSVLDFAKTKKNDKIIFITDNHSDFTDELKIEFKNEVGTEVEFFSNFERAKEYLDSELNLQLELKNQYDKYLKIVSEKIGDILVEIHKKKYPSYPQLSYHQYRYFPIEKVNYDAFTLLSINSLTNIVDNGTITTLIVHLKLRGLYHEKEGVKYEIDPYPPLPRSITSSINEPFEYPKIIDSRPTKMHEKNVDAEISISIDNVTKEIEVTDIKLIESVDLKIW